MLRWHVVICVCVFIFRQSEALILFLLLDSACNKHPTLSREHFIISLSWYHLWLTLFLVAESLLSWTLVMLRLMLMRMNSTGTQVAATTNKSSTDYSHPGVMMADTWSCKQVLNTYTHTLSYNKNRHINNSTTSPACGSCHLKMCFNSRVRSGVSAVRSGVSAVCDWLSRE